MSDVSYEKWQAKQWYRRGRFDGILIGTVASVLGGMTFYLVFYVLPELL